MSNALRLFAPCVALLLTLTALPSRAAETPEQVAIRLLDRLDAGDYAAAEASFGKDMAAAVPADKLKTVWQSLPAQAGAAKGRGQPSVVRQDDVQLVTIALHHANAELVAKIAVDDNRQVVGFLIQPAPPAAAVAPADDASFSERDFSVGQGKRALPGTLAMPKDAAAPAEPASATPASATSASSRNVAAKGVAAVVLVHGSGPQDRDETIGPNRPFLDIARGLAAQGIAVLRFDKRSHARPQDFADGSVTLDSETTDDAVAAVAALRAVPGIDPARVFVLGHSQGGMLAPRIAQRAGHVAGLVLLAAPARPLLDILIEQRQRLAVLDDGKTSTEEAAALALLKQQVDAVRASADTPAAQAPMGQPASYWRSTDGVAPVAEAQAAAVPMLVLQGARDIQVVDADWQRWKAGFHDNPNVTFKLYPALNHLGIAGEGEGNLAEYATPGHVDAGLIADVARWIQHPSR